MVSLRLYREFIVEALAIIRHCAGLSIDELVPKLRQFAKVNIFIMLVRGVRPVAFPEFLAIDVFLKGDVFQMRVDWNDGI
jgi:hypothetical protein